jgi:hypothetical protein
VNRVALHALKTWPEYFEAVASGEKTFEVRRDDRGFQKGDVLVLHKYQPGKGYLGGTVYRRVTWILTGGQLGIEPGYVVMGLKDETIQ